MRPQYKVRETYVGTGLLDEYTFDFRVLNLAHLRVIQQTAAGVVEFDTVATDTTYFTTTLNPDKTGKITLVAGDLDAGKILLLLLADDAPTQPDKYIGSDFYSLKKIENTFDWLSGQIQRLVYRMGRTIRLPEKYTGNFNPELIDIEPDSVLVIDELGETITTVPRVEFKGDKGDPGSGGLPEGGDNGDYIEKIGPEPEDVEWKTIIYNGFSERYNQLVNLVGIKAVLDFIMDMGYAPPNVNLSSSVSTVLRERGDAVTAMTLTAAIVKVLDDIYQVRFYEGASLLDTQSSGGGIPSGGNNTYNWTGSFDSNTTFSVQVDDVSAQPKPSRTSSITYSFVYPYYVGAGAAGLSASSVAGLTKRIINSTASRSETIAASAGNVFYFAYPASYGALTKITDVNTNFDTITDWTLRTENITGLDGNPVSYRIYEFNNPVTAGSYPFIFIR